MEAARDVTRIWRRVSVQSDGVLVRRKATELGVMERRRRVGEGGSGSGGVEEEDVVGRRRRRRRTRWWWWRVGVMVATSAG